MHVPSSPRRSREGLEVDLVQEAALGAGLVRDRDARNLDLVAVA